MKKLFLPIILFCALHFDALSQNSLDTNKKFEIAISFLKFNQDIFYQNGYSFPTGKDNYVWDFTPSAFFRFINGENSIRIKLEYCKKKYSWDSNTTDMTWGEDGTLKKSLLQIGYQRSLLNVRKVNFYAFSDIGLSYYNYKGSDGSFNGWTMESSYLPFAINEIGLSVQPGLGIRYQVIGRLHINLESSIRVEKPIDLGEANLLISKTKFIPGPVSLLGVSYIFR